MRKKGENLKHAKIIKREGEIERNKRKTFLETFARNKKKENKIEKGKCNIILKRVREKQKEGKKE